MLRRCYVTASGGGVVAHSANPSQYISWLLGHTLYIYFKQRATGNTCLCHTLSETVRESLVILLQILNEMTPLCYYTDKDCMGDRKQMINFSIYRSWELYDVVQKHCLVVWTDRENVKDFSCIEFTANIQFTQYFISFILYLLKCKWEWYISSNILQTTAAWRYFRKKKPSQSSQQQSGVVSCSERWIS